jgi:hypothetical protein
VLHPSWMVSWRRIPGRERLARLALEPSGHPETPAKHARAPTGVSGCGPRRGGRPRRAARGGPGAPPPPRRWPPTGAGRPVHPNATVRYALPSASKAGSSTSSRPSTLARKSLGQVAARGRTTLTGASVPFWGRSSSTQCGLGRNRQSKHHVDVDRQAVLEAERGDGDLHARRPVVVGEQLDHAVAQLVDVEVAGVDHDVGVGPQAARAPGPLLLDGGAQEVAGAGRVAAAGALVAADEHVGAGVEEEGPHPGPGPARRSSSMAVELGRGRTFQPATNATRRCRSRGSPPPGSATLGMSATGMLSMTNQPWSSKHVGRGGPPGAGESA